MSQTTYPVVWDLDVFFKGGSESPQLRQHLDETKSRVRTFANELKSFDTPTSASDASVVAEKLEEVADLLQHVSQAGAFVSCLEAQDMSDQKQVHFVVKSQRSTLYSVHLLMYLNKN